MATLSGPYRIDREDPPHVFYTVKRAGGMHNLTPGVSVLGVNGRHRSASEGWMTMGHVSKQTPFGQGISMGIQAQRLRQATADEIRRALGRDHPHGPHFRPDCQELSDAGFSLMMSGPTAPQGWTADRVRPGNRPLVPLTRDQIRRQGQEAQARYTAIMQDWDNITRRQIQAILASLG